MPSAWGAPVVVELDPVANHAHRVLPQAPTRQASNDRYSATLREPRPAARGRSGPVDVAGQRCQRT